MGEAIAFFSGLITMGVAWFWIDYIDCSGAYHRGYHKGYHKGYRDALIDEENLKEEYKN